MATIIKAGEYNPLFKVKKNPGGCLHKHSEIDADERKLTCQTCNAILDPFDFILKIAYEERHDVWSFTELKALIERLRIERDLLEKEVTNLNAARRRLTK